MLFSSLPSGLSVEENEIHSFYQQSKSNKYFYLIGGIHGDEFEAVYVTSKLFKWLQNDYIEKEISIIVIPILNVDGHKNSTRVNSHGVDLNRNFGSTCWNPKANKKKYNPGPAPSSEPETQFLMELFKKFPPGIIFSVHSWRPLINYDGDCEDLAKYISSHNNYEVINNIGYPTPGSLGAYGPENLLCPVLTFECPTIDDNRTFEDIWSENKNALQGIFIENIYEKFLI